MKNIYLLAAGLLLASGLHAQPWLPNPNRPGKLADIISNYENRPHAAESEEEEEEDASLNTPLVKKEGRDYHFERWLWYWQQHLDENGYLVSPVKTFNEWRAYTKNTALRNAVARTTNGAQWTFNGPTYSPGEGNGLGRINIIAFHPTDTNTYIIGSAGGGAWRTTTGGVTWTSLYDNLPVLGVADIDYNPLNPNTIFLCTGDGEAGDTRTVGLLKSTDGGATWDTTGLQYAVTDFVLLHNLLINPLDTNSLLISTSEGIKKSFDGGHTWINVTSGSFKQVVYSTIDTNIVFATNYNNGSNANIFKSTDGGMTWVPATGLSNANDIRVAVTQADPGIVMAVASNDQNGLEGIYKSTDTGNSFVRVYGDPTDCSTNILANSPDPTATTCSGQAWYDLCIAVSPLDANVVLVGGVNTWYSSTGGATWVNANQWTNWIPGIMTVHADKHYLVYHPLKPNLLFECNDGGVYKTAAPTSTIWNDLTNGMGISQFYRVSVSDIAPFVLGGAQDNGTKRLNFAGGSSEQTGGDGMDNQMDYADANTYYTSFQYGNFLRTLNGGFSFDNISQNIPGQPQGDWITPLALHPELPNFIMAGYNHLWFSQDKGSSWADITPTETSASNIRRIGMTPADGLTIYFLKGNTIIRHTADLGTSWNNIAVPYANEYISDMVVDPKDASRIWVTFSGYTTHKVAEHTSTGWTQHNQGLPNVPVTCITIDSSNGTLYVGTDFAVFYKTPSMSQWALYNSGLPTIHISDLGINYATNEIWAATYGRGMWKSPRYEEPTGIPTLPFAQDVITVSPNPSNGQFSIATKNKALLDQIVDVRIISMNGNAVWHGQSRFDADGDLKVNAAPLAKGTYLVEVNRSSNLFARTKLLIY